MHLTHSPPTDAVQESVASESGRGLFHRVVTAISLAASLILLSSVASAQRPQRVLLVRVGDGVQTDWAQEVAGALRASWRARGADVEAPPVPVVEEWVDVSDRLDAAWASYHALRIEEARADLLDIVDDVGREWGRGLDPDGLTELWLLLAMTQAALGDEAASQAAIERALAIDDALEVDPARYPPTLVSQVEARRALPREHGTLLLSVAPEGASVMVDGRAVTAADLTIELPVGRHWVRADAPARTSVGAEVELTEAGESLRLALPIDPGLALTELGELGAPLPRGAQEAVSFLGVSASILEVERQDDEVVLSLVDAASGARATLRASPPEARQRAAELLTRLLAPPGDAPVWPWVLGGSALLVASAIVLGVLVATAGGGWDATASR